MSHNQKKVKALGLCSGGLDSILSAVVLRDQSIHVEWVAFETPFFSSEKACKASRMTGIPLVVRQITSTYMQMLRDPSCGYGKHMNPCMDCHALMFRLAGEIMQENGFDFLFSGEVLGQRPMSQTRPSLRYVEKHSGMEGYILRPLSAQCLPETIPEKNGWVDRSRLLDISGRSRKRQMKLARQYGIRDYPSPAGGCLLTDKRYAARLRDLFGHQTNFSESELHLLRYGRHLRLNDHTKLIIGRTQEENEEILKYFRKKSDIVIKTENYPGPIGLFPNGTEHSMILLGASICAGYSKAPNMTPVEVSVRKPEGRENVQVIGIPPADVKKFLI